MCYSACLCRQTWMQKFSCGKRIKQHQLSRHTGTKSSEFSAKRRKMGTITVSGMCLVLMRQWDTSWSANKWLAQMSSSEMFQQNVYELLGLIHRGTAPRFSIIQDLAHPNEELRHYLLQYRHFSSLLRWSHLKASRLLHNLFIKHQCPLGINHLSH